jgi:hypothetical protein
MKMHQGGTMLFFKVEFTIPSEPATWQEICEVKGYLSDWKRFLQNETKLYTAFVFYPFYFFVTPFLTEDSFVSFMDFDGDAMPPIPQWYDFVIYQDFLQGYAYASVPFGPKSLKITPLSEQEYDVEYKRFMKRIRELRPLVKTGDLNLN